MTDVPDRVADRRVRVREAFTFEFLALATVLLPTLAASVGFFFGRPVTPLCLYVSVAVLLVCAFACGWRRGVAYAALVAVSAALTAFTFSYSGPDAQSYHFPVQFLLRHGWNPVFDSTLEKFAAVAGDAQLAVHHALFLPRTYELCGAIVSSALRLFVGDAFAGYVLLAGLFASCLGFARRFWGAGAALRVLFACGVTFTTKVTSVLSGYVDYATYATFCMAAFALVLFARDRAWPDLATFAAALCLCVTTKSTALLGCGLLVAASVPLLARRTGYGRALLAAGLLTAVIGASPFLTSWIQYGSPVYPYQTFDPKAVTFDMTGDDFAFNADAAGMGRLARLCYAWLSPGLTVAAIRLLTGNPGFSPSFSGCGGAEVSGPGLWFNALLLASFLLLAASPKNRVTGLCAVIFATACLVPLKVIGYARYVPQLWMIFPLAVLNFASAPGNSAAGRRLRLLRRAVVVLSAAVLAALAGLSLLRTLAFQGRMLVEERLRQNLIASFPADRPVRVSAGGYRFTNVQRFRQAGRTLVKAADGEADTVLEPETALPRFDTHPEIRADLDARFPLCNGVRSLFVTFRWADVFRNLPRPLRE